jgi:hypothetical protein
MLQLPGQLRPQERGCYVIVSRFGQIRDVPPSSEASGPEFSCMRLTDDLQSAEFQSFLVMNL